MAAFPRIESSMDVGTRGQQSGESQVVPFLRSGRKTRESSVLSVHVTLIINQSVSSLTMGSSAIASGIQ